MRLFSLAALLLLTACSEVEPPASECVQWRSYTQQVDKCRVILGTFTCVEADEIIHQCIQRDTFVYGTED